MKCEQQLINLNNQAYLEIWNNQSLLACLKCLYTKVEENALNSNRDMAGDRQMHTAQTDWHMDRQMDRHGLFQDSPLEAQW